MMFRFDKNDGGVQPRAQGLDPVSLQGLSAQKIRLFAAKAIQSHEPGCPGWRSSRFPKLMSLLMLLLSGAVLAQDQAEGNQQQATEQPASPNIKLNTGQWLKHAASGDLRALKIMHAAGFQVNQVDPNNRSGVLHHAAANGQNQVISWVLKYFAHPEIEINSQDVNGFTPLDWAAYHGQADTVALLLKHQANPNVHPDDDNPLLIFAVQSGSLPTVKTLLDFAAQLSQTSYADHDPVTAAESTGNQQLIDFVGQTVEQAR